jgi:hypothetical protein
VESGIAKSVRGGFAFLFGEMAPSGQCFRDVGGCASSATNRPRRVIVNLWPCSTQRRSSGRRALGSEALIWIGAWAGMGLRPVLRLDRSGWLVNWRGFRKPFIEPSRGFANQLTRSRLRVTDPLAVDPARRVHWRFCANAESPIFVLRTDVLSNLLSGQGVSLRRTKRSRRSTPCGSRVSTSMNEKDQDKNRIAAKGKEQLASELGRWERIVEAIGSGM